MSDKIAKPAQTLPKYMFENTPVTGSTWLDLQQKTLTCFGLADGTALLLDTASLEYCFVYWDEGAQCSNPYESHVEAVAARAEYIKHLEYKGPTHFKQV